MTFIFPENPGAMREIQSSSSIPIEAKEFLFSNCSNSEKSNISYNQEYLEEPPKINKALAGLNRSTCSNNSETSNMSHNQEDLGERPKRNNTPVTPVGLNRSMNIATPKANFIKTLSCILRDNT